ncbi:MAG: hypothetical protein LC775_01665 [Acidobacteria bacterium]|nr:hypothetical protein [Acidobacteriota bacterium]
MSENGEGHKGLGGSLQSVTSFIFPVRLPALVARSDIDPLVSRLVQIISPSIRLPNSLDTSISPNTLIDDFTARPPENLRVTFLLQQIENEIVSGSGAGGAAAPCFAWWEARSSVSVATAENGGPFALPVPGPGEIWPIPYHNGIYDAIVQDGCGNTEIFPVELHSWITENTLENPTSIGEFSKVDDTTLQSNGFWNFAYPIRAIGTNGDVSDIKFRGIVSVTCANIETL